MKIYIVSYKSCDDGCWGDLVGVAFTSKKSAEKFASNAHITEVELREV